MKHLSLIEKAFFLKKICIFNDLDLDLLLAISDKMHQDIYDKGEKVFEIDQVANRMYLIAKGSVELLDSSKKRIKKVQAGSFFGDASLFNEKPRTHHATCAEDTLLLTLSRTDLLTIISECPNVAVSLLQYYTKPHEVSSL